MFAFAPEADHLALTREWDNRRVSLVAPEDSLVLRKATLQVGHGGGRRFLPDSYAYNVLKVWVSDGAPGPGGTGQSESTRIVGLDVFPHERIYRSGQTQQLRVVARYADGHMNDVTRRAAFDSLESGIASVDSDGQLVVTGSGQAAIMVRFRGQTAVSHAISPFSATPAVARRATSHNLIDTHVARRWERLNMRPAPRCGDAEFIRRAFLDCLGTLPRAEVVQRFLASDAVDKRERLVDQILGLTGDPARDLYIDEWST
ncbi:MAG TPA: S-layer related protein (Precursor), partial [Planctomycetaceae bacterium]|nr:S-layer related protein (Precursor) [Planctomycetaceae bacterium]